MIPTFERRAMSWIPLTLCSALVLGIYDLLRKATVKENAVPPVLFLSVLTGSAVWLPLLAWSHFSPQTLPHPGLVVHSMDWATHGLILIKAMIVSSSWVFAYFAVKHLPVTISSPIRSTSPVWTIMLALVFLGESPSATQWVGIGTILLGFYAFTLAGKLEGIHFHRDKWVAFMMIAAIVAGGSGFYDRWLFLNTPLTPSTVQCWFSIYLVIVLLPFLWAWTRGWFGSTPFQWRWSIPLVGLSLLVADLFYFSALTNPEALISVVSPIRRTAVIVSFIGGALVYKERKIYRKAICLVILVFGVIILESASRKGERESPNSSPPLLKTLKENPNQTH
jgi:bacterial/archaeal transporter family protein